MEQIKNIICSLCGEKADHFIHRNKIFYECGNSSCLNTHKSDGNCYCGDYFEEAV